MKTLQTLGLLLCCGLLSGCGGAPTPQYGNLGLLNVTGQVQLNGQPLPSAVVIFEDQQSSKFSYGLTDSNGHYKLQFDSNKSGTTPGTKIVRISTTTKILGLNSDEEGGETDENKTSNQSASKELVPVKYNKESTLQVDVDSSKTKFDFNLEP